MKLNELRPDLLKASVFGANDGIITTFAVVAGVAGAGLSSKVVIILGIANMVADGCSMGIGDYLGEKSERRLRRSQGEEIECSGVWKTGLFTFVSFVIAGVLPLIPYVVALIGIQVAEPIRFPLATIFTFCALFIVGSLRTVVTKGSWLKNGFEMLTIGAIAAVIAYGLGYGVEQLLIVMGE